MPARSGGGSPRLAPPATPPGSSVPKPREVPPSRLTPLAWTALTIGVVSSAVVLLDSYSRGYRQRMPVMDAVWPITSFCVFALRGPSRSAPDPGQPGHLASHADRDGDRLPPLVAGERPAHRGIREASSQPTRSQRRSLPPVSQQTPHDEGEHCRGQDDVADHPQRLLHGRVGTAGGESQQGHPGAPDDAPR